MSGRKPMILIPVALAIVAAGSLFYLRSRTGHEDSSTTGSLDGEGGEANPSASPAPGAARYPVPTEGGEGGGEDGSPNSSGPVASAKLPPIDESDQAIQDALTRLFSGGPIARVLNLKDIVRRFVVTVNNLPEQHQLSQEFSLLRSADGDFLVTQAGELQSIDARNYARYAPYLSLLQGVESRKLVGGYVHFYPLFQSAYRDLGSQGYFNDRVVQVIDNLLDTPEPPEPVHVVLKNTVFYKYADPSLESLSVGQKALLRMGPDDRRQVKEKLREIRARLIHLGQPGAPRNS